MREDKDIHKAGTTEFWWQVQRPIRENDYIIDYEIIESGVAPSLKSAQGSAKASVLRNARVHNVNEAYINIDRCVYGSEIIDDEYGRCRLLTEDVEHVAYGDIAEDGRFIQWAA